MTREEALHLLKEAGIPNAATDVRRLYENSYLRMGEKIGKQDWEIPSDLTLSHFAQSIRQRLTGKPVSQIIGGRGFWKYWFQITPDVLDPRPETETLVEHALDRPFERVLDLGTGSGCILISLLKERPVARGLGTDISSKAIAVAEENAKFLHVSDRATFERSDWFDKVEGLFDLIISNPPYIAASEMSALQPEVRNHEPRSALTDEADGLTAYRIIAQQASNHLLPGGRLLLEIGPTQAEEVVTFVRDAGFENITVHQDLDGRDRCIEAGAEN